MKSIRRFAILIYSILYFPVAFRHLCNTFWFWWLNEKYDSNIYVIEQFDFDDLMRNFMSLRAHCTDGITAPHVCHPSLSLSAICVVFYSSIYMYILHCLALSCDVFLVFFYVHLHITLFGSYLWCIFIIFPCTFTYYIVWLLASQIKSGSTQTSIMWGHIP